MMYDERFVTPMRQELTRLGVEEMRTPAEVDAKLKDSHGTTLVVVNSVCGCAARNARPAVAQALQHDAKPDHWYVGRPVDHKPGEWTMYAFDSRERRRREAPRAGLA